MGRSENVNQVRRILLLAAGRRETQTYEHQLELPFAPATVTTKSSATNEELIDIGQNLHGLALELVWLLQMEVAGLVRSPIGTGRRRLRLGALPAVRILEDWDAVGDQVDSPQESLLSVGAIDRVSKGAVSSERAPAERAPDEAGLVIQPPSEPSRTREQSFLDGMTRARALADRLALGRVELAEFIRRLYTLVLATKAEDDLAGLIHGHGQRHRLERTPRGKLAFKVDRDRSRGQGFFTTPPTLIQELTRAIIDPAMKTGQSDQLFLDPACGSGQFLLAAAVRYCTRLDELDRLTHVHGVDIDPIAARIAAQNLSLWAAEFCRDRKGSKTTAKAEPGLAADSSLRGAELDAHFGTRFPYFLGEQIQVGNSLLIEASSFSPGFVWEKRFPHAFDRERPGFDVVLGNPPWVSFGLRDRAAADEDERAYFERLFPAGTQYKLTLYPLFMELALRLCRPGGYHGFLVPDSVLTGHHFSRIRECLVRESNLKELTLVESAPWPGAHVGFTVFYSAEKKQPPVAGAVDEGEAWVRNRVLRAKKKRRAPSLLRPKDDPLLETDGRFIADEVQVPAEQYSKSPGAPLRVFRNQEEMTFLTRIQKSPFTFGQVIWTYSGLIARFGQKSIQSDRSESRFILRDRRGTEKFRDDDASKRWSKALWSGSEVTPYRIEWQGGRVYMPDAENQLSSVYKSGFDLSRYRRPKVFLRQTGDRLIAGLDREGYFSLNNLHLLGGDEHYRISPLLLVGALMSKPVQDTYRIFALEGARPLAQVDLKTVESLPYPVDASGFPLGGGDSPPRTHPQSRRILRSIDRWLKVEDSDPILELIDDARELGPDPYREGPLLGRDVLALAFLRVLELREEEIQEAGPTPKRRGREKGRVEPESALQDLLDEMFALVYGVGASRRQGSTKS